MDIIERKDKLCEICKSIATNICIKCLSYYCDSCFKIVHAKNNNDLHIKDKIDGIIPINTKCPVHPKYPLQLFCTNDKGNLLILYFK